jgi:hypothetical protein
MLGKDDIPLDFFYIKVNHFAETKPVFQEDEESFGDYLLLLRYKSGLRKTWDIGKQGPRWLHDAR